MMENRTPLAVMELMADPDPAVVSRGIRTAAERIAQAGRVIVDRPHVDGDSFVGSDGTTKYWIGWILHRENHDE